MAIGEVIRVAIIGFNRQPIAPNGLKNLSKYKYNGVDRSLLSKYVLGPYWNWLVAKFPLWMAPNTITLLGLLAMASACLLVLCHSPDMTIPIPPWLYVYVAACLFIYQSLDAIDGKQARRTGMAGPLGELFDHGCDAVNLVIMGFISPALFMVPPGTLAFSLMCFAFLAFYTVTWEEYHTGIMNLGYISGPVEGTIALIGLCLAAAVHGGGSLWNQSLTLPNGITVQCGSILLYSSLFIAGGTAASSILNTLKRKTKDFALLKLLPFSAYLALSLALYSTTPQLQAFPNFILFFVIIGMGFACSVARVITAHISKEAYPLWTPAYLPPIIIMLWKLNREYYEFVKLPLFAMDARFVLFGCLGYSSLVYYLLITRTICQICSHTGISCFTVAKVRRH